MKWHPINWIFGRQTNLCFHNIHSSEIRVYTWWNAFSKCFKNVIFFKHGNPPCLLFFPFTYLIFQILLVLKICLQSYWFFFIFLYHFNHFSICLGFVVLVECQKLFSRSLKNCWWQNWYIDQQCWHNDDWRNHNCRWQRKTNASQSHRPFSLDPTFDAKFDSRIC